MTVIPTCDNGSHLDTSIERDHSMHFISLLSIRRKFQLTDPWPSRSERRDNAQAIMHYNRNTPAKQRHCCTNFHFTSGKMETGVICQCACFHIYERQAYKCVFQIVQSCSNSLSTCVAFCN